MYNIMRVSMVIYYTRERALLLIIIVIRRDRQIDTAVFRPVTTGREMITFAMYIILYAYIKILGRLFYKLYFYYYDHEKRFSDEFLDGRVRNYTIIIIIRTPAPPGPRVVTVTFPYYYYVRVYEPILITQMFLKTV
jgi:hypothetical protein